MLKKFGAVSVGVTAALLAAAPLASAHEGGGHEGHHGSKGHHEASHENVGNTQCAAKSGDTKDNNTKGLLAGVGPIANGNAGQIASCNSFLNDVLSHNDVNIANDLL